ncbi:hypothetical protein C8R44DRAFT_736422 [Mycena epipterygia]|nr:hypothetical protein C8R44DRAFT_736422 [Mycena epipterygia]
MSTERHSSELPLLLRCAALSRAILRRSLRRHQARINNINLPPTKLAIEALPPLPGVVAPTTPPATAARPRNQKRNEGASVTEGVGNRGNACKRSEAKQKLESASGIGVVQRVFEDPVQSVVARMSTLGAGGGMHGGHKQGASLECHAAAGAYQSRCIAKPRLVHAVDPASSSRPRVHECYRAAHCHQHFSLPAPAHHRLHPGTRIERAHGCTVHAIGARCEIISTRLHSAAGARMRDVRAPHSGEARRLAASTPPALCALALRLSRRVVTLPPAADAPTGAQYTFALCPRLTPRTVHPGMAGPAHHYPPSLAMRTTTRTHCIRRGLASPPPARSSTYSTEIDAPRHLAPPSPARVLAPALACVSSTCPCSSGIREGQTHEDEREDTMEMEWVEGQVAGQLDDISKYDMEGIARSYTTATRDEAPLDAGRRLERRADGVAVSPTPPAHEDHSCKRRTTGIMAPTTSTFALNARRRGEMASTSFVASESAHSCVERGKDAPAGMETHRSHQVVGRVERTCHVIVWTTYERRAHQESIENRLTCGIHL